MKKIIIILALLILCACSKSIQEQLLDIGYCQEDVDIIETFNTDGIDLFLKEYNPIFSELIHVDNFEINNLLKYSKYYGLLQNDELIKLVNNNKINKYLELIESEYFVQDFKDLYMSYFDNYDNVRDLLEIVNTERYFDLYTHIKPTDISKNYLMLINKYNCLDKDYEPDDLVDIDPNYGKGRTRKAVYDAFVKMADDARSDGYYFTICSAYRSYDYQQGLYQKYLDIENGNRDIVDTYSARPGHSEHQSGLCLDLTTPKYGMEGFGKSEAYTWVNKNCYKYGFIIRYTKDKENITGYESEEWQVRYVGSSDIAKDIIDRNITFDEYYNCFVR